MSTIDFKRALQIFDDTIEVSSRDDGGIAIALNGASERIVTELASMYAYAPHPTEVASEGVIIFKETAGMLDGEDEEDESDDTDGMEDEDSGEDDEDEDEEEGPGEIDTIDNDGRALRILNTQEGHKFATRIYNVLLGNEDMGRYAAFLNDFDNFLHTYKGGDVTFASKRKNGGMESAGLDVLAQYFVSDDTGFFETAAKKTKKGRAGMLSVLMKAMSGELGDKLVSAWDSDDSASLREALSTAIDKVIAAIPSDKAKDKEAEAAATDDPNFTLRPRMVTLLMKATKGDLGAEFFDAIEAGDAEKAGELWPEISTKMLRGIKNLAKEA